MQRPYLIISLSVCCGLSCALWRAPARVATPPALRAHAAAPETSPEHERIVAELERWHTRLSADERNAAAAALLRESERHALELELVLGVIRVESAFNNFARSDKGALGLMQVMPATGELVARDLGIEWRGPRTLLDPVTNVRIGTAYLAEMRRQFGSVDRALAAYNWGPGAIQRKLAGGSPVPLEYASNVQEARLEVRDRALTLR
jgi:soluble lytic murein transglycosylase-like protein